MFYLSKVHLGSASKVPSSRKWRPVPEGLAKVEMKRPRDWKAPWRTWKEVKTSTLSLIMAMFVCGKLIIAKTNAVTPPSNIVNAMTSFNASFILITAATAFMNLAYFKKPYPAWLVTDEVDEEGRQFCPPHLWGCAVGDYHETLRAGFPDAPQAVGAQVKELGHLWKHSHLFIDQPLDQFLNTSQWLWLMRKMKENEGTTSVPICSTIVTMNLRERIKLN